MPITFLGKSKTPGERKRSREYNAWCYSSEGSVTRWLDQLLLFHTLRTNQYANNYMPQNLANAMTAWEDKNAM